MAQIRLKMYEVGGCVRDELMGIESKDIDYSVEILNPYDPELQAEFKSTYFARDSERGLALFFYNKMNDWLTEQGFQIFLPTPDCFTTRAKFPKEHKNAGTTADFVLCRREIYNGPTRIPSVTLGTLQDDLMRRDFTVNAIAKTEEGEYIDLFDGIKHIERRVLYCPLSPLTSFHDDPLRIIRAFRFSVTKGLILAPQLIEAIRHFPEEKVTAMVSTERIREELLKMFKYDTIASLEALYRLKNINPGLHDIFFSEIWIKPTLEHK